MSVGLSRWGGSWQPAEVRINFAPSSSTEQQPSLQPSQKAPSSTEQQPTRQQYWAATQSAQSTYLISMRHLFHQAALSSNPACHQAALSSSPLSTSTEQHFSLQPGQAKGRLHITLVWSERDKGKILSEWVPLSDNKGWPLSNLASSSLWGQTFSAQSATCILLGGHGHRQSSRWPLSAPQWHNSSTKLLILSEIKEGIT